MPRSFGLWRAIVRRLRADAGIAVAAALILLVAATLLTTAFVYGDAVAVGGLRRALLATPGADRRIVVTASGTPSEAGGLDATVGPELARSLGAAGGEVSLVVASGSFAPAGASGSDPSVLVSVGAYADIRRHASLTAGRWTAPGGRPLEAVLSVGAARVLGVAPGDTLTLAGRVEPTTVAVVVVGIWRPDPTDAYWTGSGELDGTETAGSFTTRGPVVLDATDLAAVGIGRATIEWRVLPAVGRLEPDGVRDLRAAVASLQDRLSSALPGRGLRVATGLPGILAAVEGSILVGRGGILLLTALFAVLAGYAILLVGGMLVDRRRPELAILRSRGTSTAHLAAMSVAEGLLLAVPAVVVAPPLALLVVRLLGAVGPMAGAGLLGDIPIGAPAVGVAALAALIGVVGLTVPTVLAGASPGAARAERGRPGRLTTAGRYGIDLAVVALAALAIWQVRFYGSTLSTDGGGTASLDPLLLTAPALGLLAGGMVATRLLPRLAGVGERATARVPGLVPSLGTRQLARRPLRYTRAALLLMLAAGLGTFAAAYGATWRDSQAAQAAYAAVGDIRVTVPDYPDLPAWGTSSAYRAVDGVRAVVPVVRRTVDVGRALRGADLLAVGPAAAASLWVDSGEIGGRARSLLAHLPEEAAATGAVPVPGRPIALEVTLDADVVADPVALRAPIAPSWPGLTVTAILEDADGRIERIPGGVAAFVGRGQRIAIPLAATVDGLDVTPTFPVRLRGLELAVAPPVGALAVGSLEVHGVSTVERSGGAARTAIDAATLRSAWSWVRVDERGPIEYRASDARPGRVSLGRGPGTTEPIAGQQATTPVVLRWWAPLTSGAELPAIASERFLAETGGGVGDVVGTTVAGVPVTVRIVAETRDFPPLDPARPFLVVPIAGLEAETFTATGVPDPPAEWWIGTKAGGADDVAATLARRPYSDGRVVTRSGIERSLAGDPAPLGVVGALGLGALAAVAFAAIGFVVSIVTTARERVGEFALLRAVGLSPRELSASLVLESSTLLGFGVLVGSALGLALAWLVLPVATVTASGSPAVPEPSVIVPWVPIALLCAGSLALLFATVWSVSRILARMEIGSVIREGEL